MILYVGLYFTLPYYDQRDQPIVFDAVHATFGCTSEIICG